MRAFCPVRVLWQRHGAATRMLVAIAFLGLASRSGAQNLPPGYITGVTATASSAQVSFDPHLPSNNGLTAPNNVIGDTGLRETPPGSGVYALTTNGYENANNSFPFWNSGYRGDLLGGDENPVIQFDLGAVYTVDRFHIWNFNGDSGYTFRGVRSADILFSTDGAAWKSVIQRFTFARAPGTNDYTGEDITFSRPVTARYLRFFVNSTYRSGGNRELAGLGKVRFHAGGIATPQPAFNGPLPADGGIVNVSQPPYNAKGDGVTDDTAALQSAINDFQGTRQTIYLPNGTYLVSRSLRYKPAVGFGFTNLRGQSQQGTILRLKDGTFTDPTKPTAVLYTASNTNTNGSTSADWFNNNVGNLTIDIGAGNPGAVGLQYYSNNVGAARNITIRSGDGQGVIGLDLAYADQNGPLLVKNVTIDGFKTGIACSGAVNSQTLEHITLRNQSQVGIHNNGQCVSIRDLNFAGSVPAVQSDYGVFTLVDSILAGSGVASTQTAVTSGETLFARNIVTSGYAQAVSSTYPAAKTAAGPTVAEFVSAPILSLFPSPQKSLNLPVSETPIAPQDDPNAWANVRAFRQIADADDTDAVQRAIDSGAATLYFPGQGTYDLTRTVLVRGSARRIVGMFGAINTLAAPTFQIADGAAPTVWIEDMISSGQNVNNASSRVLVVANGQGIGGVMTGTGPVYLENVVGGPFSFGKQSVWARQLNLENTVTNLTNTGGQVWILGLKTEQNGTLLDTEAGGKTELLGGLCYTQNNGATNPMFINRNGSFSATIGEVAFNQQPYLTLLQETRDGLTRTMKRQGQTPADLIAPRRYDFLVGSVLPLYVGYRQTYAGRHLDLAPYLTREAGTGDILVTLYVTNTGSVTVNGAMLTAATLAATGPTTGLPAPLGALPVGASASATLRFPGSVGAPRTNVVLRLSGTASGSAFGGSYRVLLP